jgi:hypothetical protein
MSVLLRISPFSALKVGFLVGAFLGLIPGIFCTTIAIAGVPFAPHQHLPHFIPLFAIIFAPLFWGTVGAILTALIALVYNLASRWTGGLNIDLGNSH